LSHTPHHTKSPLGSRGRDKQMHRNCSGATEVVGTGLQGSLTICSHNNDRPAHLSQINCMTLRIIYVTCTLMQS